MVERVEIFEIMAYHDVECPYCGSGQEIIHDDGYGYDEGDIHNQWCPHCEKYFIYQTSVSFSYYPEKADCLNGMDHIWKKQLSSGYYPDRKICTVCGEIDNGKWQEGTL